MKSLDEMATDLNFTAAKTGEEKQVTFLPEPERAERRYTLISVDDHIVEPPHPFEGRMPAKFVDRGFGLHAIDAVLRVALVDDENVRVATEIGAAGLAIMVDVEHDHRFFLPRLKRPHE